MRETAPARRPPVVGVLDEVGAALLAGGVFAVDKPRGPSSAEIVERVKSTVGRALGAGAKTKVGHGGTLDPQATGVLVIGVGRGTRMLQSFLDGRKAYEATVILGSETDTLDVVGQVVKESPWDMVTREALEALLPRFRGTIKQVPPMYSALKIDGKRLYKLAQDGVEVERDAREVVVHSLEILGFEPPLFNMSVECGKGLYVRSLGSDLARAAGTVGHLMAIRRTRAGSFGLADCLSLDEVDDAANIVARLARTAVPSSPTGRQRRLARRQASNQQRRRPCLGGNSKLGSQAGHGDHVSLGGHAIPAATDETEPALGAVSSTTSASDV